MRQEPTADLEPINLVQIIVGLDRSELKDLIKCRINPSCLCIVENKCHSNPRVFLDRSLDKSQGSPAIPPFRRENFKHFCCVIDSTPAIMRLAIYPHKHLIEMPAPVLIRPMMDPSLSNFRSKHRAEPVPPKPHRLVAGTDAALEQDVVALGSKQSDVVRCPGNGLIRIAPAEHL